MPEENSTEKAMRAVIAAVRSEAPEHILDYLKSKNPDAPSAELEALAPQVAAEIAEYVSVAGVMDDEGLKAFDFAKFEEYRRKNPKRGEVVQFEPKP